MRRESAPTPELLAAYVDGVSELTPEERRRVEDHLASDASARADETATRKLLGQLRDLPPPGGSPDWAALERSIGEAVGPTVPRSWWQRFGWRLVVPCTTFASAAAILFLSIRHPPPDEVSPPLARGSAIHHEPPGLPDEATLQLWLDGANVEVDDLEADQLLEVPWAGDVNEEDLLPASDLAWIDELDAEALTRAESWLAHPQPDPPRPPRGKKRS
jgi:hypothetical protein